jgi:hypothetical protein
MNRLPLELTVGMRTPAIAIAAFVMKRGAASSAEILATFQLSEQTLRRRRPELRQLGIDFVGNGSGSYYVERTLVDQLPSQPTNYLPTPCQTRPLRPVHETRETPKKGVDSGSAAISDGERGRPMPSPLGRF